MLISEVGNKFYDVENLWIKCSWVICIFAKEKEDKAMDYKLELTAVQ
jgi:hypothetical protein